MSSSARPQAPTPPAADFLDCRDTTKAERAEAWSRYHNALQAWAPEIGAYVDDLERSLHDADEEIRALKERVETADRVLAEETESNHLLEAASLSAVNIELEERIEQLEAELELARLEADNNTAREHKEQAEAQCDRIRSWYHREHRKRAAAEEQAFEWRAKWREALEGVAQLQLEKNGLYEERALLLAYIVQQVAGIGPRLFVDPVGEPGFDMVLAVDVPGAGQLTWHLSTEHVQEYFENHLHVVENDWDGHTTQEKLRRLRRAVVTEH